MKRALGLAMGMVLLNTFCLFAQKSKKVDVAAQETKWHLFAYPFYTIQNGVTTTSTGCFIRYKDSSYFVTSKRFFFTPLNEKRKLSNVMIFVEPNNMRNNAKALSLNMKKQRLLNICADSSCSDIVLLPIIIPNDYNINYAELAPSESLEGKEMAIAGYVQDTTNVITTQFSGYLKRDNTYFLTEHSNTKDQSGSPVLMMVKNKVVLAGVYAGRELSQDNFNKGLVAKASLINEYFEVKPLVVPSANKVIKKKNKKKN